MFAALGVPVKRLLLLTLSIVISSCSQIGRDAGCSIAPETEGWVRIDKPKGIDVEISAFSKEYLLWFQRPDGLVKSCRRDVSYKCLEVGKTYREIHGQWQFQEETDFIVCT